LKELIRQYMEVKFFLFLLIILLIF